MPTLFETYEITERVGDLTYGTLHRARDRKTNAQVLLVLPLEDWPLHEVRSRLLREHQLCQSLLSKAAGVQRTLRYVQESAGDALVLGFFPGAPLDQALVHRPLSLEAFFPLALSLCGGVDQVHKAGLVLRNLTPRSVLVDQTTWESQLVDFSLAWLASQEARNPGLDPVLTWEFRSPEQTGRLGQRVDYRSDYYSLGMLFYTLVTGRSAFAGLGPLESIHAHLAKTPVRPEVPGALADVILKLLAKAPEHRYQTMTGLVADLTRCRDEWQSQGTLGSFELGSQDSADRFQLSQTSVGRDRERAQLRESYVSAAGGHRELLLVSGPSGVGKSTLVQEVGAWVLQDQGLFLQGKFDQTKRDQPYWAFIQCIEALVASILQGKGLARWKQVFLNGLRGNLAVLSSLVPEIEQVVGPQPALAPLPPQETENRFRYTLALFVRTLLAECRPVVIFLDDVQWMDPASALLMDFLLTQDARSPLMIVAAYREGDSVPWEASATRPVLVLGPLTEPQVTSLVSDTLGTSVEPMAQLGRLLFEKTRGNPFFVTQLLRKIHQDGLLFYHRDRRAWAWDAPAIEALVSSETVFDLLISNIRLLDPDSQRCLALAAGLGSTFRAEDLALFSDELPDLGAALAPLVDHHYLVPLSTSYLPGAVLAEGEFQFQHDRIRQAAWENQEESARAQVQLKLARGLWRSVAASGADERVGEVAGLFLPHLAEISDPQERIDLARLFLQAGEQSRSRSARQQALEFFARARDLTAQGSPGAGAPDPGLVRTILFRLAEMRYLSRQTEQGDALCLELLESMKSPLEKAEVFILQIDSYAFLGENQTAIERGLQALKLLDAPVSLAPNPLVLARELILVSGRASMLSVDKIFQRKGTVTPRVQMLLKLLGSLQIPANLSSNSNFPVLLILKATDLALRHGNNPDSAQAFCHFAILLSGLGNPKRAYEFGTLAIRLSEAFPNPKTVAHVHNVFSLYCLPWNRPWAEHGPAARRSAELALGSGDQFTLAYETGFATQFNPDLTLDQCLAEGSTALQTIADVGLKDAWIGEKLSVQKWRNLTGDLPGFGTLSDDEFDFAQTMAVWKSQGNTTGQAVGYSALLGLLVVLGETDQALETFRQFETVAPSIAGSAYMAEATLFTFLLHADLALDPDRRAGAVKILDRERKRLAPWALSCPENFAHWKALMDAEVHRVHGRVMPAAQAYEKALNLVDRASASRDKALIHERAAAFHLARGYQKMGAYLMREAYQWYEIWGARQKGVQLERRYPSLSLGRRSLAPLTQANSFESPDVTSIIKVTQAISREMDMDRLLETVILTVVESAGAQQGWLLLKGASEPGWTVAARGGSDGSAKSAVLSLGDEGLSLDLVERALESREGLVLADALADPHFASDPALAARKARSILCLPFGPPGGKVSGIWYLENNLVAGAFSAGRREALGPLSSQIAISLENARNYRALTDLNRTLERKVEERTAEIETQNRQFMSSVEYAAVLQQSLLPHDFGTSVSDHFAVYAPRDPVGGDLYWFHEGRRGNLLVLLDCTGHGVPGALLTVVVHSLLSQLVREGEEEDLASLAQKLNDRFRRALGQNRADSVSNDGFDLGVCWWSPSQGVLRFLGAHIGLFVHDQGMVTHHKGARGGLGYPRTSDEVSIPVLELPFRPGALYVMTTDGALGQIGGPKSISLGRDRFAHLVGQGASGPLADLGRRLLESFHEYRQPHPQLDDVTMVGFRIREEGRE